MHRFYVACSENMKWFYFSHTALQTSKYALAEKQPSPLDWKFGEHISLTQYVSKMLSILAVFSCHVDSGVIKFSGSPKNKFYQAANDSFSDAAGNRKLLKAIAINE